MGITFGELLNEIKRAIKETGGNIKLKDVVIEVEIEDDPYYSRTCTLRTCYFDEEKGTIRLSNWY